MFTIKYFKHLLSFTNDVLELFECESPWLEVDGDLICFRGKSKRTETVKYTMVKSIHFCGTELPLDSFGKANSLNCASL